MKFDIELLNGDKAALETDITLAQFRAYESEGLIGPNFIKNMIIADTKGTELNVEDVIGMPYVCYKTANPEGMSREEFDKLIQFDFVFCTSLYWSVLLPPTGYKDSLSKAFAARTKASKKAEGVK